MSALSKLRHIEAFARQAAAEALELEARVARLEKELALERRRVAELEAGHARWLARVMEHQARRTGS